MGLHLLRDRAALLRNLSKQEREWLTLLPFPLLLAEAHLSTSYLVRVYPKGAQFLSECFSSLCLRFPGFSFGFSPSSFSLSPPGFSSPGLSFSLSPPGFSSPGLSFSLSLSEASLSSAIIEAQELRFGHQKAV